MPQDVRIIDLRPSLKTVSVQFIVLEGAKLDSLKALVADYTASVTLLITSPAEVNALQPGCIFRLIGGIFFADDGSETPFLRAGKRGVFEKVGEFSLLFSDSPNMSTVSWVSDPATHQWQPKTKDSLPVKFWQPPAVEKKH